MSYEVWYNVKIGHIFRFTGEIVLFIDSLSEYLSAYWSLTFIIGFLVYIYHTYHYYLDLKPTAKDLVPGSASFASFLTSSSHLLERSFFKYTIISWMTQQVRLCYIKLILFSTFLLSVHKEFGKLDLKSTVIYFIYLHTNNTFFNENMILF